MTDYATRRRIMVDTQVRPSDVTRLPIIEAMLSVPREQFVPNRLREAAYLGEHLPLDKRRVILDPRSLAKMLDALDPTPRDLVLDLGTGFGYSSAVLSHLAQAVVAVEPEPSFATEAQAALAEQGIDNVAVETGTLADGAPDLGPFDAVIVQGGVQRIPDAIADQIADGGRMVAIFMEGNLGTVRAGVKVEGRLNWRYVFNVAAPVLPGFEVAQEFSL